MRKADVVTKIADETGLSKVDVMICMESFFNQVKGSLKAGEPIFIRGFGTFTTKLRAQKMGRNIKAGESVIIPEHKIPYFKPSPDLSKLVK